MASAETPTAFEHAAMALAEAHNRSLKTGRYRKSIRHLHRELEERVASILTDLREGDPEQIRKQPHTRWLLDNGHLLRATLHQIKTALPRKYYRELPTIDDPADRAGRQPRVTGLVSEAISVGELPLDLTHFERFCNAYQRTASLKIGELWALPTMLRIALVQKICSGAEDASEAYGKDNRGAGHEQLTSVIGACITSLRNISTFHWESFIERISCVDRIFRNDPSNAYHRMDFQTRDDYRTVVEQISRTGKFSEWSVANTALLLAQTASRHNEHAREHHIGYFLIDNGLEDLLRSLGLRQRPARRILKAFRIRHAGVYIFSLLSGAAVFCGLVAFWLFSFATPPIVLVAATIVAFIPALSLSTGVINSILSHLRQPRRLPKLDFSDGIPHGYAAVVAVPAMLSSRAAIDETLHTLELNYLGNAQLDLQFVLLTDYADAGSADTGNDQELLDYARRGIDRLQGRYSNTNADAFVLLHRKRRWNDAAGRWMGWERKRGKLMEFNDLLRGSTATDYTVMHGKLRNPSKIRFVITLDADTLLPAGAAAQLIGTLAHPLNAPVVNESTGEVSGGYNIIQPRLETNPASAGTSLFARIFSGDVTLDLYTHAVSNVYQDLFARGIFAGKGIYDVDSFRASLRRCIPDNRVLSHDLLEGLYGRAALASDIVLFEDYPTTFLAYRKRMHRWIRGDWQLLPWLLGHMQHEGSRCFQPGLVGRWQLLDNLFRSLFAPAITVLLVLGWLMLPVNPWIWMAVVTIVPGLGILLRAFSAFRASTWRWGTTRSSLRNTVESAGTELAHWILVLAFLPADALLVLDAIGRILYRLRFSHRDLLEWTTAADAARATANGGSQTAYWKRIWAGPVLASLIAPAILVFQPASTGAAVIILLLWALSPVIAHRISRIEDKTAIALDEADKAYLRRIARQTWRFFEQNVGPDSHWLPPDNIQLEPAPHTAKQTSPTNIGFALLSAVAAYDLGYTGLQETVYNLNHSLLRISRLQKYRGHLFNWYSLEDCRPLMPRYVSTVDSGNLLAALIVVRESLLELAHSQFSPNSAIDGIGDDLLLLRELLARLAQDTGTKSTAALQDVVDTIEADIREGDSPHNVITRLAGEHTTALNQALLKTVIDNSIGWTSVEIEELRNHVHSIAHRSASAIAERKDFYGWREALARLPTADACEIDVSDIERARHILASLTVLSALPQKLEEADEHLKNFIRSRPDSTTKQSSLQENIDSLRVELVDAIRNVRSVLETIHDLVRITDKLIEETDFRFLYDRNRHLFHVGYRVDSGELDSSYYDLLASEARLASYIAIAKGDAPPKHWTHLGRPLTSIRGLRVLLSWSATSFEYLMPCLLMRTPRFGLLSQSCRGSVKQQRLFAKEYRIPWGVSESGYHHFDQHGRYQYQAFGIPRLGLQWDQGERLVISGYSSMLALPISPAAVIQNAKIIEQLGGSGEFGLYEALDFGAAEHRHRAKPMVVKSYMAHHQGMILNAIANCVTGDKMVDRFHRDARIASAEYLLYEQLPRRAHTQPLETFRAPLKQAQAASVAMHSWTYKPGDRSVAVLANQRLSSRINTLGGGNILWRGHAITRWQPEVEPNNGGSLVYVKDVNRNVLWSPGPESSEVAVDINCRPDCIEFRDTRHSLLIRQQVVVAPFCDVEIRKLTITNDSDQPRQLMVCAYSEPVLAAAENDARHPVFSKLFLEDEYLEDRQTLMFSRRSKNPEEPRLFLATKAVIQSGISAERSFETDRREFLGRNGDRAAPKALQPARPALSCRSGVSLDPISAIAVSIDLPARRTIQCAFLSAAGDDETQVLRDIGRFESFQQINWTMDEARHHAQQDLMHLQVTSGDVQQSFEILGAALFPPRPEPERAQRIAGVRQAQSLLWRHGISGDRPLITIVLHEPGHLQKIESLVKALSVCQARGMVADIVFVDESDSGYAHPVQDRLRRLIEKTLRRTAANRRFTSYILSAYSLGIGERSALSACSQVYLDLRRGDWPHQLRRWQSQVSPVPAFLPQPSALIQRTRIGSVSRPSRLQFDNGLGGLSAGGDAYTIYLDKEQHTPAPWCNILANPQFGTLISESGSAYSWYQNSGEFALTPWSNDPVLDPTGEALYLRDEETGLFWSPMPGPARDQQPYSIRHTIGSSRFDHNSEGLEQTTTVFVDPSEPVKYVHLHLRNRWPRTRRLTITYAAEWRLTNIGRGAGIHLMPGRDEDGNSLFVRNGFSPGRADTTAFLTSNLPAHGVTCNGREFLGPNQSWRAPAGLQAIGLSHFVGPCALPMAVYQVHVSLAPDETCDMHFSLGVGQDSDKAHALARQARVQSQRIGSLQAQQQAWKTRLEACSVKTGDAGLNALLNYWLPYQVISSRFWGRMGFYQASGGFGFRDQLQDVLALLNLQPGLAAEHIKEAAGAQFEEGDVLHWWHRDPMRGVRTRCSDDLLWLPYVVSHYVDVTEDHGLLDQRVPFLNAEPLSDDEMERYAEFRPGNDVDSIYEHCCRAIECRMKLGRHGLPLIGSGDWNDGFSRVGIDGSGESVWLAWFLIDVCRRFEPLCQRRQDTQRGAAFRRLRTELNANIEANAWAGDWYLRGFYDDGSTLGGPDDAECRIDLNAQTWAILVGTDSQRKAAAMKAVRDYLIDDEHRLIKLLTPPFHSSDKDPGYIKSYPPGVRENGGQYNHAATWAVWAAAESGNAELAFQWLSWLNPLMRSSSREDCEKYRIEPYVIAADVYGSSPFTGWGGWSWYSGSAAWFYRVALEKLLGVQRRGDRLFVKPCVPKGWSDFTVSIDFAAARYVLHVHDPARIDRENVLFVENSNVLPGGALELQTEGDHDIHVYADTSAWQQPDNSHAGESPVADVRRTSV